MNRMAGRTIARRPGRKRVALILGFLLLPVLFACGPSDKEKLEAQGYSHYTCPMHPQIHEYRPGTCPICHMDLVPVKLPESENGNATDSRNGTRDESETGKENPEDSSGSSDASESSDGSRPSGPTVNISQERQQLIGVSYSPVRRMDASFHLETTGRGAFDPELGVAVKEYLMVHRDPSLREAAISRLKLLGMGTREIANITRYRAAYESLYNPRDGGPVWVYATLYESDAGAVKPGYSARVHIPGTRTEGFQGEVISLSPVVGSTTRTIDARILVPNAGGQIRPDSFVHVDISVPLGEALVIPRSAIVDNGQSRYVFVHRGNGRLEVRNIEMGPEIEEGVVVLEGLEEGELVVDHGTFLIDSEAQLKSSFQQFDRKSDTGHSHGSGNQAPEKRKEMDSSSGGRE
ncbi:MAG: efflux RND transporter periplasmic adaptor subunit [Leptospiraceae bacterium]|nr:efflux RND transporter periplasmic adaptor subunit [Leptospiraceae bacterium]